MEKEVHFSFKNERGNWLYGFLHLPEKEKAPLVITCHGFDGSKTDKKFIELGRFLQKEGIALLRFDFEGCGDSQGRFEDMTIEREASDLNYAFNAVLKEANLDQERMALVGHSLGTVVIPLFFKKFKVPVRTLVFWNQAFNQRELFKLWNTKEEMENWERNGYLIKGDKKMGKDYLKENKDKDHSSLLAGTSEIPILLVHGGQDEDVPSEFSERLANKHKNIELKILPEADHGLDDFNSRQELIRLTVKWLKKHL